MGPIDRLRIISEWAPTGSKAYSRKQNRGIPRRNEDSSRLVGAPWAPTGSNTYSRKQNRGIPRRNEDSSRSKRGLRHSPSGRPQVRKLTLESRIGGYQDGMRIHLGEWVPTGCPGHVHHCGGNSTGHEVTIGHAAQSETMGKLTQEVELVGSSRFLNENLMIAEYYITRLSGMPLHCAWHITSRKFYIFNLKDTSSFCILLLQRNRNKKRKCPHERYCNSPIPAR
jgi:hypothetical protein